MNINRSEREVLFNVLSSFKVVEVTTHESLDIPKIKLQYVNIESVFRKYDLNKDKRSMSES